MKAKLVLALVLSSAAMQSARAEIPEVYKHPYDAVYQSTSSLGDSTTHQMCDGKGHVRIEGTQPGGVKTDTVMNYSDMTMTNIMHAQKMLIKTHMNQTAATASDWSKTPAGCKSLGSKVINSHPCHGYESVSNGTTVDTWVGDDVKMLVHSETKGPQAKIVMDLKSYSPTEPKTDLLAIPSGYKDFSTK